MKIVKYCKDAATLDEVSLEHLKRSYEHMRSHEEKRGFRVALLSIGYEVVEEDEK